MARILLDNITFSYGEQSLLQDFSLQVASGEICCLLGSSGCGKTTILRLLAGLEVPQKGNISIDGKLVSSSGQIKVKSSGRSLAYIFQDLALWPHLTVYENVAFGPRENKWKDVKTKVENMLAFFGLQEMAGRYPHQLSGGQQQMLAIARSMVMQPKVLLMDEPLSNVDVKYRHKILELVKELREKFGLSIVYVTHDHREAFAIADKVVVMNKGRIEAGGSVEEVKNSQNEFVRYFLEY